MWLDVLSTLVAVLALGLAIVLNIYPSAEREMFHRDLFRRWSDLREDIDSLLVLVERLTASRISEEVLNRIQDFTAKKNRINGMEDAPDEALLEKCYEEENRTRTGFRTPEEYSSAQGSVADL